MKNLKFKEGVFSNIVCKGQHAFEQYSYDELFEPMELEGVACDYKELKAGDKFILKDDETKCHECVIRIKTEDGFIWADDGIRDTYVYEGTGVGVINLGKLKTIPEKFTVKTKEFEIADCVCGGKCKLLDKLFGWCVYCEDCVYSTPLKDDGIEAIKIHNKMMEGLKDE